jgi:hypothetical protein
MVGVKMSLMYISKEDLDNIGHSGISGYSGYSGTSGYIGEQFSRTSEHTPLTVHKKLCPFCCGRGKVEKQGWFGKIKVVKCRCIA